MSFDEFGILIVDDEPNIRSGLEKGLKKEAGFIDTATNAVEALEKFRNNCYQLVIADIRLPSAINGLELIEQILRIRPETTAIIITAHGTVETAVEAMRCGAFDFITKPLDLDLIRHQVGKARDHYYLQIENRELRDRLADAGEISGIIGNCSSMQNVLQQVRQVANTDATVMIHGESGTGKELVARAIHELSPRGNHQFVAVNLGALPETLLESELFGHEKGAFTGAFRQMQGCFERADNGSLFMDEVTEMTPKCQIDLLRVLETQNFSRIGGEEILSSNARIISATNKPISELIEEGTFREDLYYRLNVIPIHIPPLRNRRDDIPLLVEHFLNHFCQRHHREIKQMAPEAIEKLYSAQWPGNVRQLRNLIERLVVTTSDNFIHLKDIPTDINPVSTKSKKQVLTLSEVVESAEKETILQALNACEYHREKSAKLLGISLRTLHYKMNRYGLH